MVHQLSGGPHRALKLDSPNRISSFRYPAEVRPWIPSMGRHAADGMDKAVR